MKRLQRVAVTTIAIILVGTICGVLYTLAFAQGEVQPSDPEAFYKAKCVACHGPNGNSPTPQFPILAGQTARYLYLQLRDFKEGRREAAAMRDMASAELTNLQNETIARIIETRARAVQDQNLIRLYRGSVLPQARAAVQASLSSYRVGRVTFMTLVDNQMTVNRYETESYRLRADYHQAVGELEALVGREVQP